MIFPTAKSSARLGALLGIVCLGLAAAGCSSSSSSTPATSHSAGSKPSGTVSVAYAASLLYLNEKIVAPAFQSATGLKYTGRAGPSGGLQQEIAAGEISPNVFEAVGGDNITPLFPKFTKWYVQYAGTSIAVAYNPKSKYASDFAAIASGKKPIQDLFTLMEKPGFKLGRTDPNLDPQGRAFIYMLELAQAQYHLPSDTVSKILGTTNYADANSPQIFDEAALPARLQAGQLDASSAYQSQAIQLHLHYILLPVAINLSSPALANHYHTASITITGNVTKHGSPLVIDITTIAPPSLAGTSYVKYVLSPAGLALYKHGGYTVFKPTAFGTTSAIPSAISSELG
jgi:molybdate/tungstate transport system substrate-binding protein